MLTITWPIILKRWGLGYHTEAIGVSPTKKKARSPTKMGPTMSFLRRCEMHQPVLAGQQNQPEEAARRRVHGAAVLWDVEHMSRTGIQSKGDKTLPDQSHNLRWIDIHLG